MPLTQEEQRHLEAQVKRSRRKSKRSKEAKKGTDKDVKSALSTQLPVLKEDKFLIQSYIVGNLSDSAKLIASLHDTQNVAAPTEGSMGLVISNKKLLELWDQTDWSEHTMNKKFWASTFICFPQLLLDSNV